MSMTKCATPHNIRLPHEQLHGVLGRAEQGRMMVPHNLHGRAIEQKVPLSTALQMGRSCTASTCYDSGRRTPSLPFV